MLCDGLHVGRERRACGWRRAMRPWFRPCAGSGVQRDYVDLCGWRFVLLEHVRAVGVRLYRPRLVDAAVCAPEIGSPRRGRQSGRTANQVRP